jgi:hypothetical protein
MEGQQGRRGDEVQMTKYASSDCGFFCLGPNNCLSALGKIIEGATKPTTDTTPLGVDEEEFHQKGRIQRTLTQEGWFDDSAGSVHDALSGLPAVDLPLLMAHKGNVAGRVAIGYAVINRVGYDIQLQEGDVTLAKAEYTPGGDREEAIIVMPLAARAAAGNTDATYVDLGAAGGPSGGAVYEAVTALTLSGYTNAIHKLRHSTDHITFTPLVTMTAVTVPAAERKTTASAINRYVSGSWEYTGSGASPTVTSALAVHLF